VSKNVWRKVRVVVEVPVRGDFSEKDLAWEVKRTTEHAADFLLKRNPPLRLVGHRRQEEVSFGRVSVKEFSRVVRQYQEERQP